MPLDVWFPLAIHYVDGAIDDSTRTAAIDALHRRAARGHDGAAAWTGDVNGDDQLHNDPAFEVINIAVTTAATEYLGELGYDLDQLELYAQRSWAVICRPGQLVAPHCHANAHLSAVIYLSAPPGSGALRFTNTAQPNALSPGSGSAGGLRTLNELNYATSRYDPVDGRIVVFPSQQRHDVLANDSTLDRLSLSYDLMVSSRNDRPGGVHEFLMPPPSRWRRLDRCASRHPSASPTPRRISELTRRAPTAAWTLPRRDSHPLWRTEIVRDVVSCAVSAAWATQESDARTDEGVLEKVFDDAVDVVYDRLTVAARRLGVSVEDAVVHPPRISERDPGRPERHHLTVLVRIDREASIEVPGTIDGLPFELAPGSLAMVSGVRDLWLDPAVEVVRFVADVPALARSGDLVDEPAAGLVDFYRLTARPLEHRAPTRAEVRSLIDAHTLDAHASSLTQTSLSDRFLVDGCDPAAATDEELAAIAALRGRRSAHLASEVRYVGLLDDRQCDDLIEFARHHMTALTADTVDGRPEYQVNLGLDDLSATIGPAGVSALENACAAGGARVDVATTLADAAVFVRQFSPATRAHLPFHSDISAWTLNVPLEPVAADGGELLMLCDGRLVAAERHRGVALSHSSALVHGVNRVTRGERWSLIVLLNATAATAGLPAPA